MEIELPVSTGVNIPVIADYELLRVIGRGAYGEIWLARGLTGALRAVKIVHRKTFESVRAFNREFSGMSAFEPISRAHDGFVDILHVGRNDAAEFFYYVMELADDETAGVDIDITRYTPKTLKAGTGVSLPVSECVRLGLLITEALGALHDEGLTHRDIKPSNIIFVDGAPKLADIGLVAASGEQSFVGTEGYVAPEGPGTPQADIYSLGKLLYEISMGKDRFDFPEVGTDLDERPDKLQLLELNTILLKACASNAAKRYSSAREMCRDLERLLDGLSPARRRWPLLLSLVATVVLLIATSLVWHARRRGLPVLSNPAFASATINTNPPGAIVLLGDRMKRSPAQFDGIEPGKYQLRVMLPDFDPVETRVELAGGQLLTLPAFELQHSKGSVQLASQPDAVEFEISRGGEPQARGTTPTTLRDLPTGLYDAVARRDEWEIRDRIEIKRGEVTNKLFDFATGKVAISSQPTGAAISIDGKARGVAPLTLELTAGTHHLAADYQGWPAEQRDVPVDKNAEGSALLFEFTNGSVKIISAPPGATVLQDARELGVTPLLIEDVKPGDVGYELRLGGFRPASVHGVVQAKRQTFLDARLEKVIAALRGAPWNNSLGMHFVPVGDFQLSVWETRVKDWVAFCRATGRAAEQPDFPQTENDPVVKVNWRDATDFCEWLTQEERRRALIDENEIYRLPTDQEWSLAAGIGDESGATPEERDGSVKGVYAWGKQWPPSAGAGNFADQASARRRGSIIDGYTDGFATTSPVGSFKPNALGIHDLSGNVWEWCADLYKPGSRWGVLRGGSWANSSRTELLSSYRNVVDRNERDVIYGFRCVLAQTRAEQDAR